MKIALYREDKEIDYLIRLYGISRLASVINVSASLISQALKNKSAISEKYYEKIKEILY